MLNCDKTWDMLDWEILIHDNACYILGYAKSIKGKPLTSNQAKNVREKSEKHHILK